MNPSLSFFRRPLLARASVALARRAQWSSSSSQDPHPLLQEMLSETGLDQQIQPVRDLGYFGWTPNQNYDPTVLLKDATAQDIKGRIYWDARPPKLQDTKELRMRFLWSARKQKPLAMHENLETVLRPNRFPFGQTTIATLCYLAQRHPDVYQEMRFLFGSYALYYLACQTIEEDETCLVVRLPNSPNSVLVTKHGGDFQRNYSGWGFQFEHFVTTGKLPTNTLDDDPSLGRFVVHAQAMKIGGYNVVVQGEIDGVDVDGNPTEVVLNLPHKRRFQKFFQAVSTGSVQIWRGRRDNWKENKAELTGLEVLDPLWLVYGEDSKVLQKMGDQLATNMKELDKLCSSEQELPIGQVKELSFYPRLSLLKSSISVDQLFPNDKVVQELLGSGPN